MDGLRDLRKRIDSLDEKILDLLNQRAEVALEIGRLKSRHNKSYHSPSREMEVLKRLEKKNHGPFQDSAIRAIYREIMSASLALEEPIKVAYFGPEGTFTHLACMKYYGNSAEYLPVHTIREVFEVVEREQADYGVVPVENSTEGMVNNTLDMFLDSDLLIYSEILMEVSHHLMSLSGEMERVRKVYSHPQPMAQCRRWLETHLVDIPVIEVESTARAAQMASKTPEAAAIASEAAVTIYGLKVIRKRIEDNANNYTRFLSISRRMAQPTGADKTSILFSFRNRPGALFDVLRPFAEHGINLTRIESRPSRKKAWEYVFYVDLEGHMTESPVREVLDLLEGKCFFLKKLGSYPRAGR